jgi:hypothetical protein
MLDQLAYRECGRSRHNRILEPDSTFNAPFSYLDNDESGYRWWERALDVIHDVWSAIEDWFDRRRF